MDFFFIFNLVAEYCLNICISNELQLKIQANHNKL